MVEKILKQTFKWVRKVSLEWIVKSDIEHLSSSLEHRTTGRPPVVIKEDGTKVELRETACEHPHSINEKVLTPEEELIGKQREHFGKKLIAGLSDAVEGDEDLELLFMCFEDGIDKPEAIADETGWDIKKVYNLKKKLLRRAAKIGTESKIKKEEL